MLTINQVNKVIKVGLGNGDYSAERMLAAIEGAVMGVCYLQDIKTNKQFVTITALITLVEGVERAQRAEELGL